VQSQVKTQASKHPLRTNGKKLARSCLLSPAVHVGDYQSAGLGLNSSLKETEGSVEEAWPAALSPPAVSRAPTAVARWGAVGARLRSHGGWAAQVRSLQERGRRIRGGAERVRERERALRGKDKEQRPEHMKREKKREREKERKNHSWCHGVFWV
jgi:hypothetical protein